MTASEASALVSDAVLKALVAAGARDGLQPFGGSSTSVGKLKKLGLIERRTTEVKHGQWTAIVNNWHPTALGAAVLALRGCAVSRAQTAKAFAPGRMAPFKGATAASEMNRATMRDLRLRAETRGEVDPVFFAAALEAHEDIIAIVNGSGKDFVDEACETPADVVEALATAIRRSEEREERAESDLEARRSECAKREDEADEKVRAIDATCRELHARAEKAEHNLAASIKNGFEVDAELHKRVCDQGRMIDKLARAALAMDVDDLDSLEVAQSVVGAEEYARICGARTARRNARLEHDRVDLVRVTRERDALKAERDDLSDRVFGLQKECDALAEQVRILRERRPLKRRGGA